MFFLWDELEVASHAVLHSPPLPPKSLICRPTLVHHVRFFCCLFSPVPAVAKQAWEERERGGAEGSRCSPSKHIVV